MASDEVFVCKLEASGAVANQYFVADRMEKSRGECKEASSLGNVTDLEAANLKF